MRHADNFDPQTNVVDVHISAAATNKLDNHPGLRAQMLLPMSAARVSR